MLDPWFLAVFPWYSFFAVLSFLWGSCIGSFLSVCVSRIPRDESIVTPRSHCPGCRQMIPWHLNIPLLSYILLGAKCKFCGRRISPRYFILELLTATLFLLVWMKFDLAPGIRPLLLAPVTHWQLVPIYWLALYGLLLATFVDLEHYIIPDRVSIGGVVAGVILSAAVPALHDEQTVLWGLIRSVTGATVGFSSLWLTARVGKMIFKKDAMGFGDVKLLAAIGAFLGTKAVLFVILASSLTGSIVGITLVALGNRQMQSRIPYGPYLALGALLWIFWGPAVWAWYEQFLYAAPVR